MHGEVLTYNSGTGVLTVDINNHTGSGTYSSWVVNVGGVTPATSVAWGAITGTLSSQTDLNTALSGKAPLASPTFTGTVTIPSGASISGFAPLASPTFTGTPTLPTGTIGTTQTAGDSTTALATTAFVTTANNLKANIASPTFTGDARAVTPLLTDNDTSIATTAYVKGQGYLTSATAASTYLTSATAASTYYLQTNPSGFISDAPSDSNQYARYNGTWAVVSGGGGGVAWGAITGTLSLQTDLQGELDLKANLSAPSFTSGITVDATGITFSDSTVQTTAIATGPAGANGLNGAMNYLDIVTMTSSSAGYYESGGGWYAYYGFMNTGGGWFYNKLNASGVTFKLYINGIYDSSGTGAYNYMSAFGTLVTTPVSGDVITIFISDGVGDATIPLVTYTY